MPDALGEANGARNRYFETMENAADLPSTYLCRKDQIDSAAAAGRVDVHQDRHDHRVERCFWRRGGRGIHPAPGRRCNSAPDRIETVRMDRCTAPPPRLRAVPG